MSSQNAVAPEPHELPEYAGELAAFHQAFLPELKALVASVPLAPQMRLLDVGCGDGFCAGLFADRLIAPGAVFRTQCIHRKAPIDRALEFFLQSYLQRLAARVETHLNRQSLHELDEMIDPARDAYLPLHPHFALSWLNVLARGRRPPQVSNRGRQLLTRRLGTKRRSAAESSKGSGIWLSGRVYQK